MTKGISTDHEDEEGGSGEAGVNDEKQRWHSSGFINPVLNLFVDGVTSRTNII